MKKPKSTEKPAADFSHHPFKSLKGLKPALKPPAQKPQPRVSSPPAHEDEEALFLHAVSGARALHHEQYHPSSGKPQTAAKPADNVGSEEHLFLQAVRKMGGALRVTSPESECENEPRHSASRRARQLKRGTIRIRAELDLHGSVRDEALAKLEKFVRAAAARGDEAVLIITGKGINSPEGPVLQGAVDDWLRGKGKTLVADFCPAPRDRGGSGAVVVFPRTRPR